jgi:hypothetical protein
MFRFTFIAALLLAAVSSAAAATVAQDNVEQEIARRVEALRQLQPDPARATEYNRQMDESWKYYDDHAARARPALRAALAAEIAKPDRNSMVLLDIGYYLYTKGNAQSKDVAVQALLAIDPNAPIMRQNVQQMFYFALSVADTHDPRALEFTDRTFLERDVQMALSPSNLTIDSALISTFIYGVYGEGGEKHLWPLLHDAKWEQRALEVLIWVGTPASNGAVRDAIYQYRDYETFSRAVAFLMQSGGPEGRDIVLHVDTTRLDAQAQKFYGVSKPRAEAVNADWYKGLFARSPGPDHMPDADVRKALTQLPTNAHPGQGLAPKAIYASTVPRDELIQMLFAARHAMFERVSDEGLGDVKTTNMLINGLRFRPT